MSTRTIIEINHDFLWSLNDNDLLNLQKALSSGDHSAITNGAVAGVRILGQRHHSETLEIKVE